MENSTKIFIFSSIIATLLGCGGSDSGSNNVPNMNLNGKAIDGYITGATVYLDLNFNGQLDSNEPRVVTAEQGEFDLNVPEKYQECAQYVPLVVDVPVGAVDSDYPDTPIEEAYSMVYPPQFALSTDQDLLNLTPLTSVVWNQVEQELHENQSTTLTCETLLQDQALRADISKRLVEQEWRVANRYNITVDELYSDYIASGDSELHLLAKELVPGLQKSYQETLAILKQNPGADLAWVEFFLGQWDSGHGAYDDKWYRYELVQVSNGNFNSNTYVMSDDLETKLDLHDKNSMITTQKDGVNIESTLTLEKNIDGYSCALSEWLETISAESSGVRNTVYSTVGDWESCLYSPIISNVTQSLVTKDYQDNQLISYTEHVFNEGNDSGFAHLVGVTDSITSEDLIPVRGVIDSNFYSEESHGADYWIRVNNVYSDDAALPAQVMTQHDSDGEWTRLSNYHNGTHKTECGRSENDMSASQCDN